VGKYLEEYSKVIEDFPFDLGSKEEEGLVVEGLIGLCLGFLLENIFYGSATGVVFFGSRLSLLFFLPDARMKMWSLQVKYFILPNSCSPTRNRFSYVSTQGK
jgi:hypothetical protein